MSKTKEKPTRLHEYSNEDKCFKKNSNNSNNEVELQWLRLVLWEKKLLEEFLGFTTKQVFPNLNQQVLEGEGYGFRTLQHWNFEGSFSSESMELEKK
jgi:hypothetical protein